ncbi:hypothetical protein [Bradyrhizobium australiense]|uniref:Uncharacterized protein n=1 Tax=Bradyrhizobium australiense TaxID=2721161 RepID=A0A7Y4LTZ3_9BRAD|nr:hypothetical protein [Bradyrhizobium australiense]NOJ38551.1 hypothetical protein [Bradyrhizobium australiense]
MTVVPFEDLLLRWVKLHPWVAGLSDRDAQMPSRCDWHDIALAEDSFELAPIREHGTIDPAVVVLPTVNFFRALASMSSSQAHIDAWHDSRQFEGLQFR